MKYKKNLRVEGSKVYSYSNHVATIDSYNRRLVVHGYWSVTTSKHINHVADVFGLEKVDGEVNTPIAGAAEEAEGTGLGSIAMVAKLGDVLCAGDKKAANDWKARMLRAGLEGRGLIMPDDWDSLSEDEKERRLNGVIEQLK